MDKGTKVKCPNEQESGNAGVGIQTNREWSFGRHGILWEYCHQHGLVDEDRRPAASRGCFVDACEESVCGNNHVDPQLTSDVKG